MDVGTTRVKVVAVEPNGAIAAVAARDYPLRAPQPAWAEQEPDEIWAAVVDAVRSVVAALPGGGGNVAALSLGSAFHSLLALAGDGRAVSPSLTWLDNRSAAVSERLRAAPGAKSLSARTGLPLLPMSPMTKLAWIRENQPELAGGAAKFVGIKDLILQRLTGHLLTDRSMASASGLYDVRALKWDDEALSIAGICASRLPEVVDPLTTLRGLRGEAADALRLRRDTAVVVGGGDGFLANVGSGATRPGQANLTVGTSLGLRIMSDRAITDPEGRALCYALTEGRWLVGCSGSSGGIVLDWLARLLGSADPAAKARLLDRALALPPGAEGLTCIPYVSGERSPMRDAGATGSFVGMQLHHGPEHLWRAALEGMFLTARGLRDYLVDLSAPTDDLRVTGGITADERVVRLVASCLGQPVIKPRSHEASALGGAYLGLIAIGAIATLDDAAEITETARIECSESDAEAYGRLAAASDRLYAALQAACADRVNARRRESPTHLWSA